MVSIDVEVPGLPHPVVFQPSGRLRLRVPELAETDSIASAVLLGPSGQLLRGINGMTSWQVRAGHGLVKGVPAGSWNVQVTAPDGRRWFGEVSIPTHGQTDVDLW